MTQTQPVIGRIVGGSRLTLDVPRLIETRLLVQANSGGGKSWLLRRLLEQTHGQAQHIVIDPEDEFHTLRERHDYVLAGRDGGDCPAEVESAPMLARKLLELGVSAIVGIYELPPAARVAFVRRFLEAMVSAPRSLWHPTIVVIDEAHLFCPQNGKSESASAVIDMATRGRKRGFCAVLATQRLSKLHKDAAAECNNKLLGRTTLDVDLARAGDELGFSTKADRQRLRRLKPGTMYAYGPALSDEVVLVKVGSVKTTHPRVGARAIAPPPPPAALRKVLAELAALPAAAKAEAQTVEELRAELAEARHQIRRLERTRPGTVEVVREVEVVRSPLEPHHVQAIEQCVAVADAMASVEGTMRELVALVGLPERGGNARRPSAPPEPRAKAPRRSAAAAVPAVTGRYSRPQHAILDAIAWFGAVGIHWPKRTHIAMRCGVSPRSSGFEKNLSTLRSAGLIDYPVGGQVCLTERGCEQAETPPSMPTAAELHEAIANFVSGPQWRMLDYLIRCYPRHVSRPVLAASLGVSSQSSGFEKNLSTLRSLGFLEYPKSGFVVGTAMLFLNEQE